MTDVLGRFLLESHPPLAPGPGALGRGGVASAVLFVAGGAIRTMDLFAVFWADEAPGLDWLHDFLANPEMDAFLDRLANPPDEEDEPEILYTRSQLTTLGSEVMDP